MSQSQLKISEQVSISDSTPVPDAVLHFFHSPFLPKNAMVPEDFWVHYLLSATHSQAGYNLSLFVDVTHHSNVLNKLLNQQV